MKMEKAPGRNHRMRRSRCGRDHGAFRDLAQMEAWVRGVARGKAEAGPGMPGREPWEGYGEKGHHQTCPRHPPQHELPGPSCSAARASAHPQAFL